MLKKIISYIPDCPKHKDGMGVGLKTCKRCEYYKDYGDELVSCNHPKEKTAR